MICNVLIFVSLIIKASSLNYLYQEKTFRCEDGKYIPAHYFCPNITNYREFLNSTATGLDYDDVFLRNIIRREYYLQSRQLACEDESHESYGCDSERCGTGKFKCSDGTCLHINVRCNTHQDCSDGSDELNCGDEVNVGNCTLANGKFLCYDKLRCLDLEYACNQECNCFDCSDENENCTSTYSEELKDCPHQSFPTPNGLKCFCDPNNPQTNLCQDVKPCGTPNPCDQKCFQYKNKLACSCYDIDYISVPNNSGFICKNKVYYENLLVYTTSNQIKVFNVTSGVNIFIKKKVQTGTIRGADDHLYYTTYDDSDRKTIYKTSIKNGTTIGVVRSNSSITSIAVDYITNNLYYTTNTSLSVCSNDGKICKQLKCCNVRYVALAPKFGLMFYMQKSEFQDERFVMKSSMDGSDVDYFVDGSFRYFGLLAVDESTRRLYWMQQEENEIWSFSFDDSSKDPKLIKYHGVLVAFAIFENELLFTKVRDNEIYRIREIERYNTGLRGSKYEGIYPYHGYIPIIQHGVATLPNLPQIISVAQKPLTTTLTIRGSRIKRRILSADSDYFSYTSGAVSLESAALSDLNATRFIDSNVTFAIKDVYAYNARLHSFIQNPCAKESCDGLCLLRPPVSKMDSLRCICVCDNSISSSGQNLCIAGDHLHRNSFVVAEQYSTEDHKNEPYSSKGKPQPRSLMILAIVLVILSLLLLLAFYFMFRKRSWSKYYSTLRNWRSNTIISNDNANICDQVEL